MNLAQLPLSYIAWHYTVGWTDLIGFWRNIVWFFWHYFSIGLLVRSLFSPYRRMTERRQPGFVPSEVFDRIITNTIMRVVGFVLRLALIVLGVAALLLTSLLGVVSVILWSIAPAAPIASVLIGIRVLLQ